jgi:hypothetical protein
MRRGRRAELRDSKQFAKVPPRNARALRQISDLDSWSSRCAVKLPCSVSPSRDRAHLRRREALGPNPTAARFWVSIDSEPDPFLDGLREGMSAFPSPAKVTKPSALFIRRPGRGTWRNTNRVAPQTCGRSQDPSADQTAIAREQEVLDGLLDGRTSKEIAVALDISPKARAACAIVKPWRW